MNDVTSYEHLIDRNLIEAAQGKLDALTARRGPAQAAVAAAQEAHAAATRAYDAALVGGDPHAAKEALVAAAVRLGTALAVPPAIDRAVVQAELDLKTAAGKAMAPVLQAGVLARLQSDRRADAARAELIAAAAEHKAANAVIISAGGGFYELGGGSPSLTPHDGGWTQKTWAEDAKLFMEPRGYWPGLNADGTVKSPS